MAIEKSLVSGSMTMLILKLLSEKDMYGYEMIKKLKEKYVFEFWEKVSDTESAVRFCTSWATKPEVVDELIKDIMAC